MYSGDDLIKHFIPSKEDKEVSSTYFLDVSLENNRIEKVLDLGCSKGDSIDYFRTKNETLRNM